MDDSAQKTNTQDTTSTKQQTDTPPPPQPEKPLTNQPEQSTTEQPTENNQQTPQQTSVGQSQTQTAPTPQTSTPPTPETPIPTTQVAQSQQNVSESTPPLQNQESSSPPPPQNTPPEKKGGIPFFIWIVIALIVAVAAGITTYLVLGKTQLGKTTAKPTAAPTKQVLEKPTQAASPSPKAKKETATGSSSLRQVEGSGLVGIEITEPKPNTSISSPVTIKGRANEFEGQVNLRIVDMADSTLATGSAIACMGEKPCPFTAQITFLQPASASGKIEAFSLDAKDGSEKDLVTVPVQFGQSTP